MKEKSVPKWVEKAKLKMYRYGITQRMLSVVLGVSEDYISMIFRGVRMPKTGEERIMAAIDDIAARKE